MKRRRLLVACAAAVTAGCLGDDVPATPTDPTPSPADGTAPMRTAPRGEANYLLGEFRLVNAAATEHRFSLTVEEGDRTVLDVEPTLAANGRRRFPDAIDAAGEYRFRVAVDAGAEATYEWSIPACDDYDYLVVEYESDGFDFHERRHTVVPPPTCAPG